MKGKKKYQNEILNSFHFDLWNNNWVESSINMPLDSHYQVTSVQDYNKDKITDIRKFISNTQKEEIDIFKNLKEMGICSSFWYLKQK